MHRSDFTVKTHVQRIMAKAGARNRVGLVFIAIRHFADAHIDEDV